MRKTIYYQGPKIKKNFYKSLLRGYLLKFLTLFLIIGAIYIIFFSPIFKIQNIIIEGNQEIKQDQIQEITDKIIKNSFLGNNLMFIPTEKIQKEIDNIFLIKKAEILKRWPNQLIIKIEERTPALIWVTKEKYFVDYDGFVIKKVDKEINLPIVIDKKEIEIFEGQKIVSQNFVQFIKELYKNLPLKTSYTIDSILIEEVTFDIEVRTQQGIVLYFTTENPLEIQLNRLKDSLNEIEKRGDRVVYYIDLRLKDKVFYK